MDRGAGGCRGVTGSDGYSDVFLSYSRRDREAAINLRGQLQQCGLYVFKDDERIRAGEPWLDRLQEAIGDCRAFVVLVGRDGVRRWIGAETQVALNRYFAPHDDSERLPIFPILLEGAEAALPAFLRLFQMTSWNGADALPKRLLDDIRDRAIVANKVIAFEGCPFIGLSAYRRDQAHLFFGRQKETLDALACFFDIRPSTSAIRWLEINGNSGSGKSSLMQAGLLPLVEQGWLWRPRTGYEHWQCIGPMMPGKRPVEMLAESLARSWKIEMADVSQRLQFGREAALAHWLRTRKQDSTAFLLAIDQFEELFIFADVDERRRFDGLLATALEDPECPLFLISTVRSDFLDRFAEDLPQLVAVRNHVGRPWTLAPISDEALREVIEGPARLAGLDVSEVKEVMVDQARDEPGALPLVENALYWLWQKRTGNRLSGPLFTEQGGLAGILSRSADALLDDLDSQQRRRALELLFGLVQVDPDGRRHTRRRMPLDEAIAIAGKGEAGSILLNRLAGERARDGTRAEGPLRLITISEEVAGEASEGGRWVNLIHETLIRSKGGDASSKPQPYWPTLWTYIEKNKKRVSHRAARLQLLAREWKSRKGWARLFGLAGWWSLIGFRGLAAPGSIEHRYLHWSQRRVLVEAIVLAAILGLVGESVYWARVRRELPLEVLPERWAYLLGKDLPFPELVEVPAGSFMMGPDTVTFAQPFYIGRTRVTFQEWDACVADGECDGYRPDDQGLGRGTRPVINVSWEDAQKYVAWLGQRRGSECHLPNEAEWEFAKRGKIFTYNFPPAKPGQIGMVKDAFGEWVQDCSKDLLAPVVIATVCSYRVVRSGSDQYSARSTDRYWWYNPFGEAHFSFRVVCSPQK